MPNPNINQPLKYCTSCQMSVRDDGKGVLRPSANGGKRWQCTCCCAKAKTALEKLRKRAGRPPNLYQPSESFSSDELSRAMDDREYVKQIFGK